MLAAGIVLGRGEERGSKTVNIDEVIYERE